MFFKWINNAARPHGNFHIRRSKEGLEMVVKGAWSDDIADIMAKKQIKSLWINYAHGFVGDDLKFLKKLPFLTELRVLVHNIEDLSPVNDLHNLTSLTIGCRKFSGIDFSNLPSLQFCGLDWQKGADSFLQSKSLKRLNIGHFRGIDMSRLGSLTNLTHLSFASSPVKSLSGIDCLVSLTHLQLAYLTKLDDISSIAQCSRLTVLNFLTCRRVKSIGPVKYLSELKRLCLDNCGVISDIAPLENAQCLEDLILVDTMIEDGNLHPLTTIPTLRYVQFKDRRHYSHKLKDFPRSNAPHYFF